jgi:hypothetical protein
MGCFGIILASKWDGFGLWISEIFNEIRGKLGSFGNNNIFPGDLGAK